MRRTEQWSPVRQAFPEVSSGSPARQRDSSPLMQSRERQAQASPIRGLVGDRNNGRLSPLRSASPSSLLTTSQTSPRLQRGSHHVTWADSTAGFGPSSSDSPQGGMLQHHPQAANTHAVSRLIENWVVNASITGASPQAAQAGRSHPFTAYAVQVEIHVGGALHPQACYTLSKRYSRFFDFHSQLQRDFPDGQLPALPNRKVMKGSIDPGVVAERTESLQRYLTEIMRHPDICASETVFSFLELNSVAQLMCTSWQR
jgi:hypothetical protein